jgi:hypothetical protein
MNHLQLKDGIKCCITSISAKISLGAVRCEVHQVFIVLNMGVPSAWLTWRISPPPTFKPRISLIQVAIATLTIS